MVLIYIGMIKEKTLPAELTNKLYKKCAARIMKFLKLNEYAVMSDIHKCVKDTTAFVLWSKKRVKVNNPVQFSDYVMERLYREGKISVRFKGNNKIYYIDSKSATS
jgi:hypothetical protein